uniref:Ycf20-like protein n=1 Tax=Leersia perrieri TaxID=77586 RepID=A0A0D9XC43_9ORYZ
MPPLRHGAAPPCALTRAASGGLSRGCIGIGPGAGAGTLLRRRCCFFRPAATGLSYQMKKSRRKPVFALETGGGSSNADGEDFEDDAGFLGRTRLGRLIQAAARELLEKLNSARSNSPTKIFLVLLGFYTANALATILGQTGDWDVLVAGVVVAAIEGIGMLMYRKPVSRPPGRFQSLISMVNYWKAGVCLGLFVDAFKLGS